MSKHKQVFFLFLILAFSLSACNLQLVENTQDPEAANLELTAIVQQMLIDQAAQQGNIVEITTTPGAGNASPTEEVVIPAEVLPPSVGDVTVTVSVATNCRVGPGTAFKSIYGMPVGQVAKVIAKNSYSGYWIIEIPGQNGQTCWLWGQYATINGDTSALKEVVTPTSPAPTITSTPTITKTTTPTVTPTNTVQVVTKPNAPTLTNSSVVCTNLNDGTYKYEVTLQWTDNSNNETGFEIALNPAANNGQTASYGLGPNVTGFTHTAIFPSGTQFTSSVFAQNSAGNSSSSSVTVVCP